MIKSSISVVVLVALPLLACSTTDDRGPLGPGDYVTGYGQVVWVDLEGGAWGMVADDGSKYLPGGLPASFQEDGLRVWFWGRISDYQIGYIGWGWYLDLVAIERM